MICIYFILCTYRKGAIAKKKTKGTQTKKNMTSSKVYVCVCTLTKKKKSDPIKGFWLDHTDLYYRNYVIN